jgi:hypothetical protein
MTLRTWIRSRFSSDDGEDEAAKREEYGLPADEPARPPTGQFASEETSEAVNAELADFEPPQDPAP